MAGLIGFITCYFVLLFGFAAIAIKSFFLIATNDFNLLQIIILVSSSLLTVFMVKSLFSVKRYGDPGGVEITAQDEPQAFEFLHQLADEIGAPKPHRVFITADVNAAVFYDLSLANLFFPSKKNLIIGLGLVNVLNLGELKAVLAHEFGHFAQNSMMVGRWVYISQQIVAHMVATRDWLDKLLRSISKLDLRIAWIGWILTIIIWSIRSLMDSLFRLVIIAERALSREMEFNADLVAVSVTGSDALINALHKLQVADTAWQTALNVASGEARNGRVLEDLFQAQKNAIDKIRYVLDDDQYGRLPNKSDDIEASEHRIFSEDMARPPQMWSTHPANRDREDNAKNIYVASEIDDRDAWLLFLDSNGLKQKISQSFYSFGAEHSVSAICPNEAVAKSFDRESYAPKYRGTYLDRSIVRQFSSVEEILSRGNISTTPEESLAELYPTGISDQLEKLRNLEMELSTLRGLASGELKPSGGAIRYRGEEIKKNEIPSTIQKISDEITGVENILSEHDASCRRAHIQAAQKFNNGWVDYLKSLLGILHCTEHLKAKIDNENALFLNTWQVITADGRIGYFEKRRMLTVCKQVEKEMRAITEIASQLKLSETLKIATGIQHWAQQSPKYRLPDVNVKNWGEWCQAVSEFMNVYANALGLVQAATLEELIKAESILSTHIEDKTAPEAAPQPGSYPAGYPTLRRGEEHVLQRKLDLWNRFQLAHGVGPSVFRFLVSIGIVGGTVFSGIFLV